MSNSEIHISSLIVQCHSDQFASLGFQLSSMNGLEIHAQDAVGKFIVTLETSGAKTMMNVIESINRLDGVLSTSMVYHEVATSKELEEDLLQHSETKNNQKNQSVFGGSA